MSQLSQMSEGGFSDIIKDVDKFIEENGMIEDVQDILGGEPSGNLTTLTPEDGPEYKPNLPEYYGSVDYPQLDSKFLFPPEEPQDIGTEEYVGPHNFEVYIIPNEQKTPWEHSSKLNKIFIGINVKFPVAFSVESRPESSLFIRATPIYNQSQFFQEIVHRCVAHRHPQDISNKNLPPHVFQHIIRCSNDQTRYFGDKNKGIRLSVVTPLEKPQTGSEFVKEFYHFVCKNSCPSGMNRRPIDVVFTLENDRGEVLGRRLLSVRICSCPKRDREKEEKNLERNSNPAKGKKRKCEGDGNKRPDSLDKVDGIYSLNINIVGKNNYLHLLNVARDRMASEILISGEQSDYRFAKCYNEISALIDKTKSE